MPSWLEGHLQSSNRWLYLFRIQQRKQIDLFPSLDWPISAESQLERKVWFPQTNRWPPRSLLMRLARDTLLYHQKTYCPEANQSCPSCLGVTRRSSFLASTCFGNWFHFPHFWLGENFYKNEAPHSYPKRCQWKEKMELWAEITHWWSNCEWGQAGRKFWDSMRVSTGRFIFSLSMWLSQLIKSESMSFS